MEHYPDAIDSNYDLVVDGIFGYSFNGEIRDPFKEIIKNLKQTKLPVISIDIPSGWDVDKGPDSKSCSY